MTASPASTPGPRAPRFSSQELPMLIPHFYRWTAEHHPDHIIRRDPLFRRDDIASISDDAGLDGASQWRSYTAKEIAQLIDKAAHTLGEGAFATWPLRTRADADRGQTEPIEVAAFLDNDTAGVVALEALIKRGLQVLTLSPRNSPDILVEMLVKQDIKHLAYSAAFKQLATSVAGLVTQRRPDAPLEVTQLPTIDAIAAQTKQDPFPYNFDPKTEFTKPAVSVHTSGSSGSMPTICAYTHEMLLKMPLLYAWDSFAGKTFFSSLPLFHVIAHIFGTLFMAVSHQTMVIAPPGPPLMGATLASFLLRTKVRNLLLVPQQIDSLLDVPEGQKALQAADIVIFGGASLKSSSKALLEELGVKYASGYGLSETTALALSDPHKRPAGLDGEWLLPLKGVKVHFEKYSDASEDLPALYELLVYHGHVPCPVTNFDGGYNTGDLVELHPEHPEWFKIFGRKSSMVVLANGENAPVQPIEDAVSSHPKVDAALLFGKGQPQVGLLVELKEKYAINRGDQQAIAKARDELWPVIDKVNATLPDFARLFKNMILFTYPDKPMPRADKGSPKRQLALKQYDDDIEALYASVAAGTGSAVSLDSISTDALLEMVLGILSTIYGVETAIKPDSSLTFDLGQDSLRATMARTSIVASLRAAQRGKKVEGLERFDVDSLPANLTYQHSTPADIAEYLHAAIKGTASDAAATSASQVKAMRSMIDKYSKELGSAQTPAQAQSNDKPGLRQRLFGRSSTTKAGAPSKEEVKTEKKESERRVVFLTGSTGAFGTALLEHLVNSESVDKVICLVRSKSEDPQALLQRQVDAFKGKGVDEAPARSEKVIYQRGSPTDAELVVPEGVTTIIHLAWSVNFNLSLADFTPEIEGTVRLLQYAIRTRARFIFASSVSTLMGAPAGAGTPAPESEHARLIGEEEDVPLEWAALGYGQSKKVVERLISEAVHKHGADALSIRCGQIIGDARSGAWNASEWAPSVLRSAPSLRALPADLGLVDWITANDAMCVFLRAALVPAFQLQPASAGSKTNVVNLAHPKRAAWSLVLDAFRPLLKAHHDADGAGQGQGQGQGPADVEVLPNEAWLDRLEAAARQLDTVSNDNEAESKAILASTPALALLDTYRGLIKATHQTILSIDAAVWLTDGELEEAAVLDEEMAARFVQYWKVPGA